MIVLDDEAAYQAKVDAYSGLTLRHPERAALRSSSPLPDYDTSEAQHRLAKQPRKALLDSRFWRAALYALLIYLALSAIIAIPLIAIKLKEEKRASWNLSPSSALWAFDDAYLPELLQLASLESSNDNTTCNSWNTSSTHNSQTPYLAEAQYKLNATGSIAIRSNVTFDPSYSNGIYGRLLVDLNDNAKEHQVVFRVELQSSNIRIRNNTNVCFSEAPNNRGLSIYVPGNISNTDTMQFTVHVSLPRSSSVQTIQTYLPMFSQSFSDLGNHTKFNQIRIEGSLYEISCQHLQAQSITVKNLLAPIKGNFNVSEGLNLDTINGSIKTNTILSQELSSTKPTTLNLDTGYSEIHANVTLLAPRGKSPHQYSPSFLAHVKTFDSPINIAVRYDRSTPSMPIQLYVQNNLAATNINIDGKYQGSFNLQTKLDRVTLEGLEDSAIGTNTSRTLVFDVNSLSKASGSIGPLSNSHAAASGQSYIEVLSSFSPITLEIGSGH